MKKSLRSSLLIGALAASLVNVAPTASHAAPSKDGLFHPVAAKRIGDTRNGSGFGRSRLLAGQTMNLAVLGQGGVPTSGVSAVVINITAIKTSKTGHVRAWSAGATRPGTSVLNFPANWTGASTATLKPGTSGKISLYSDADVDLAVDVVGWYATAASTAALGSVYTGGTPGRFFDTRTDLGKKVAPGARLSVQVDIDPGMYGDTVPSAIMANVTATAGDSTGYLGAVSASGALTSTSFLNYPVGTSTASQTVLPFRKISSTRYQVEIYNGGKAAVHILIDDFGWFLKDPTGFGLKHVPLTPARIVDTRTGAGTTASPLGERVTRVFKKVPANLNGLDTVGMSGTLTGVAPTVGTYLTAWDGYADEPRPSVSNINLVAKTSRSNALTTMFDYDAATLDSKFSAYNRYGQSDVIVDVTGRWDIANSSDPKSSAKQSSGLRKRQLTSQGVDVKGFVTP